MPTFSNIGFEQSNGKLVPGPKILHANGPIFNISVSLPQALIDLYTKQNKQVPSPVNGIGLIDTGATNSCIDDKILQKLGVNPIGVTATGTAAGQVNHNIYPAHLTILSANPLDIEFSSVIGVNLDGQKANNQPLIALIGRDVLATTVFVYNGHLSMFSLSM